jgi:ABC-type lipoprotein release transport system permease subunit
MAPEEQVINMVVSSKLRKTLGVKIGDYYKMILTNQYKNLTYLVRSRITHSFKAGPGFDILWTKAFISE